VDSLQSHYDKFANISNQSYVLWQSQSYNEIIAERKAKTKALGRGILGALSIAAAVVASATAPKNYNDDYSGELAMLTLCLNPPLYILQHLLRVFLLKLA
jgi:hypothetical protein